MPASRISTGHAVIEEPASRISTGHAVIEVPASRISTGHAVKEVLASRISTGHAVIYCYLLFETLFFIFAVHVFRRSPLQRFDKESFKKN